MTRDLPRSARSAPATAGLAYWAIVFGAGFVLGTARVLWLAPAVGEERAVLIESPVILSISLAAAWRLTRSFGIARLGAAVAMGALAFALLMAAEAALAVIAFGMSAQGWLASLLVPPGLWGLIGQIAFALFPAAIVLAHRQTARA